MLQNHSPHHLHPGTTGTQVILVLAVLSIGSAVLAIILNKTSSSRKLSQCQYNLYAMQRGIDLWAQGNQRRYPVPSKIRMESDGASDATVFADSTANVHAVLINDHSYTPHVTVCPGEESLKVHPFDDKKANLVLDGDFRNDLDGGPSGNSWSNVSYANREVRPGRYGCSLSPNERSPDSIILFGDRGPKDGRHDANSWSYRLHGSAEVWRGNLIFTDGHAQTVEERSDQSAPFAPKRLKWGDADHWYPDNVFFRDDASGATDNFIAVFRALSVNTGETTELTPVWD